MLIPDDQFIRKTFVRIFTWAVILVAVVAIGYLVVGEPLLRYFYDGGSLGWLVPSRHADDRTFEQYARDSGFRFWSNLVAGVPLSLLVIYLIFVVYRTMFRGIPLDVRPSPDSDTYPAIGGALIAAAIYAIATIIRYAPSLGSIDTAMIGPPEDNMACLWTLSWAHDHLFNGAATISHVPDLFYPEGSSFVFHAWSYYNLLWFWCLRQLFNGVTSYNLLILLTFPLSGLGGYLLARYLIHSHWPAVLVGFLFAFNPAHLVRADHHLNLANIQFLPLFVLFFIKAARRESRWSLLWAGVFLTLNALVDWNYFVYCCWFLLFAYLYLAVRRRRAWLPDIAMKSTVVTGLALVILSPLVIPMLRAAISGLPTDVGGHNRFVVDVTGFFIPFADHPLASCDWIGSANSSYSSWPWENIGYLGIVSMALVVLMWKKISGMVMPYVVGLVSFVIMSLGAQPHLFGWSIPVLVPGRLVPMIPLLSNSRAPSRNIVFAYLFWSIIVAVATGQFLKTFTSRRIQIAAGIVVVAMLVFDYTSMSHHTTPVTIPKCYSVLHKDAEPFGLVDLPLGYQQTERYMLYQSIHGIPIVEGWVSRKLNQTLVDTLSMTNLVLQRRELETARVKYIVLHKMFLPATDIDIEAYRRTYARAYEDDQNIVFQVY